MNCSGHTQRRAAPPALVQAAVDFLQHDALVLEPRIRWPGPVLAEVCQVLPDAIERYESGRPKMIIPERLRAQPGRVLCVYGDAGWGREVARGKYETGSFSGALVTAAAELIQGKWKPEPAPQWVTAVPSEHHAALVQDFAQRLAAKLDLPFVPALRNRHGKQPQKKMQNSAQQLRNVLRAFQVVEAPVAADVSQRHLPSEQNAPTDVGGHTLARMFQQVARQVAATFGAAPSLPPVPVLLVDDMVDSGWTLTLAAVLLQHHGSGPVYPFALAKASPRGS